MRIYEGSPRQDFEEVLRSIGAFLDQRGMRDVLLRRGARRVHRPGPGDVRGRRPATWSESVGTEAKETLTFLDDDIARFMDEALARASRAIAGAGLPPGGPLREPLPGHRPLHRRAEAAGHLLLRAGRRLRRPPPPGRRDRQHHTLARVHPDDIDADDRRRVPTCASDRPDDAADAKSLIRAERQRRNRHEAHEDRRRRARASPSTALIVIPLIVLAGLFVWLKLTEEDDEEALELEQESV